MHTNLKIHIGTSGWAYREWRGVFYPPQARPDALLRHYVEEFPSVEINGTAYRTPTPQTVASWRSAMREGFLAAVKMSHGVTHRRRLRCTDEELAEFIAAVRALGEHLGPLLIQLPPSLEPDLPLLRDFLHTTRTLMADPAWALVVEFRHRGWLTPAVAQVLTDHRAARCVSDMPECVSTKPIERADPLYIRRHGTAGRYRGSYDDAALRRDAELVAAWAAQGGEAFVFFNNTADASAIADARRLRQMLGAPLERVGGRKGP